MDIQSSRLKKCICSPIPTARCGEEGQGTLYIGIKNDSASQREDERGKLNEVWSSSGLQMHYLKIIFLSFSFCILLLSSFVE